MFRPGGCSSSGLPELDRRGGDAGAFARRAEVPAPRSATGGELRGSRGPAGVFVVDPVEPHMLEEPDRRAQRTRSLPGEPCRSNTVGRKLPALQQTLEGSGRRRSLHRWPAMTELDMREFVRQDERRDLCAVSGHESGIVVNDRIAGVCERHGQIGERIAGNCTDIRRS